jgi:hypothetical protein
MQAIHGWLTFLAIQGLDMLAPGVAFFRKVIAHAAPSTACQKPIHWLEDVE